MTKTLLIGLALLISIFGARAQTKPAAKPKVGPMLSTYRGEYEGGRAVYTYYLAGDGQRVRHGHFESVKKIPVFVDSRRTVVVPDEERRTAGSYVHGKRTGSWTTTYTRFRGQPTDIDLRTTYTETYANGRLNGLATYANVPWKAGRPLAPTTSVSTLLQTLLVRQAPPVQYTIAGDNGQTLVLAAPDEEDDDAAGEVDESTASPARAGAHTETTTETIAYAAGPLRYDTAPSLIDPSHRPQSVRGYYDKRGYCDSTWTLHYFKGRNEGHDATQVERAQGWMTTTLWFSHGVLRREQTLQASTGELISKFALPASRDDDKTSRLVLVSEDAHMVYRESGNASVGSLDWQSPMPEHADAGGSFFVEAAFALRPPQLVNVSFRLVPTTADSTVLLQAEKLVAKARAQWAGMRQHDGTARPAKDTTGAGFQALYLRLEDLLRGRIVDRSYQDSEETELTPLRDDASTETDDARDQSDPYPWLSKLVDANEYNAYAPEEAVAAQRKLLAHLRRIQKAQAQLAARLKTATQPAADDAAAAKP